MSIQKYTTLAKPPKESPKKIIFAAGKSGIGNRHPEHGNRIENQQQESEPNPEPKPNPAPEHIPKERIIKKHTQYGKRNQKQGPLSGGQTEN